MKPVAANLVIALLMLAGSPAYAAKCFFQVDTVDVVTGEPIRWTEWKPLRTWANQAKTYAQFAVVAEGDRRFLGVSVGIKPDLMIDERPSKDYLDNLIVAPEGSRLLMMLADESVLELTTSQDYSGEARFWHPQTVNNKAKQYRVSAMIELKYELDAAALTSLRAQGVTDVRVSTASGDYDFSSGKKPSARIQEMLACIDDAE